MNRMKRRALKKINQQLGKVARELRKREPEWKPGMYSDALLEDANREKMEGMITEIRKLNDLSVSDVMEAVARVQTRWGVVGKEKHALSHLLKLAREGLWE